MNVTLWGTRGSLASPGPETVRYGGNTSCVEVRGDGGTLLVLDAGTGIRRLGASLEPGTVCINLLLTHLHMDHIQGLGFFEPLFRPGMEVHIWGPASSTQGLKERLGRYLSPPLFPVRLRDLPSQVMLHDVPLGSFVVGEFTVEAALVCHPGPTVGYRISDGRQTLTYLPDHEPALGSQRYPGEPEWLSGYALAADADLLIHDAQYSAGEYPQHVGWGHSSIPDTFAFAAAARVRQLVTFHHDPEHPDDAIDWLLADASRADTCRFEVIPGTEGTRISL